jgi:uncharacterized protein
VKILEFRTVGPLHEQRADGTRRLVGHAAVFDSATLIAGEFNEQIARGAFKESIATGDIRALFNHDTGKLLARTKSGTLRLKEDAIGLRCEIDVPNTQVGRDTIELVRRGDITGMSFGFHPLAEDWDDRVDPPLRTLKRINVVEVSVVPWPAYEQTDIAVRLANHAADAARARIRMKMRQRGIAA